jgi:hypothetical protein
MLEKLYITREERAVKASEALPFLRRHIAEKRLRNRPPPTFCTARRSVRPMALPACAEVCRSVFAALGQNNARSLKRRPSICAGPDALSPEFSGNSCTI